MHSDYITVIDAVGEDDDRDHQVEEDDEARPLEEEDDQDHPLVEEDDQDHQDGGQVRQEDVVEA